MFSKATEGATVIILQGLFGLGFSEAVVVAVAILLVLGPKNIAMIKPLIKSVYKSWLKYQRDVYEAQSEMKEVRESILEPIKEAEREAEVEFRQAKQQLSLTKEESNILSAGKAARVPPRMAGLGQKRFQASQQSALQRPSQTSSQEHQPAKGMQTVQQETTKRPESLQPSKQKVQQQAPQKQSQPIPQSKETTQQPAKQQPKKKQTKESMPSKQGKKRKKS
jgi:Sec-independent protein translocase protein TatA